MAEAPKIELYSTTTSSMLQVKKNIQSIKMVLDGKRVKYDEYYIDMDEAKKAEMSERSGKKGVPQLFIGGVYCGGWEELQNMAEDEILDDVLAGKQEAPKAPE